MKTILRTSELTLRALRKANLANHIEIARDGAEALEQIRTAGVRAAALTRQLLAFSRKQVLQPQTINLNKIVAGIENMLRRVIGEDIELITICAPDLGPTRADPGQIEQVVMNLAVNSRDAMPFGGKLAIKTGNVELSEQDAARHLDAQPGSYVSLTITDTGCGMDEAIRARIFEPFYTTKDVGKGTGLGLATVYGIVQQSGGHIEVESEVNKGTTFKIYFSGYTDDTIIHHGVLDPGTHFIAKPFSISDLTRKVREVLDTDRGGPGRTRFTHAEKREPASSRLLKKVRSPAFRRNSDVNCL